MIWCWYSRSSFNLYSIVCCSIERGFHSMNTNWLYVVYIEYCTCSIYYILPHMQRYYKLIIMLVLYGIEMNKNYILSQFLTWAQGRKDLECLFVELILIMELIEPCDLNSTNFEIWKSLHVTSHRQRQKEQPFVK
jgi:predicted transglutaminase-like protease